MRATRWCWCIVLVGCGLAASASAQQAVRWQVSLETAKRLASQTNRLVLIHFWADWCQPCQEVEREVFTRPEVASAIESSFVPVRINVDHFPQTRQQFGITVLPTEVIITPEGQLVRKIDGVADARQYLTTLNQVAAMVNNRPAGQAGGIRGGPSANMWGPGPPDRGSAGNRQPQYQSPGPPSSPGGLYAGQLARGEDAELSLVGPRYAGSARPALGGPPRDVPSVTIPPANDLAQGQTAPMAPPLQPAARPGPALPGLGSRDFQAEVASPASRPSISWSPPPTIQLPPGNPPLGLDGYCPVELSENKRWVLGDLRWGLLHQGGTYLFAGPEQRDRFDADPDRYAPMASGDDVVLLVERGERTPGRREHGGWFGDRVYLFSGQATYVKFSAAPQRYVTALVQMSQQQNVARLPYGDPELNRPVPGPASWRDLPERWR